jgi:heat shock protein HslJ
MKFFRALALAALMLPAACAAPADEPGAQAVATPAPLQSVALDAQDDGSFLERIDPLGGQWHVQRIATADFARFKAWMNFSGGGFINHGAGCAGGYPVFYRVDGQTVTTTRREAVRIGKCEGTAELVNATPAARAAAGESERQLATFVDRLSGWRRQGDTLFLTAADGTEAILTRPAEPNPELAGRWLIESIGGEPLVTERQPATLGLSMNGIGAHGDCNSMGATFSVPAPGRIVVTGPIVSTAIGCAPEDMVEDNLMARAMMAGTAYRFEGDRLIITGGPGMIVRRPPVPNRRLVGEYEHCGNTLLGAYHEGPITLSIGPDTIRDQAQCVATYRADGPDLRLQLAQGEACGDPVLPSVPGEPVGVGGETSLLSATRPDGYAFNEQGQLIMRTNRGLLTMCRKGEPKPFGSG